nr:unnamed protein product [Callosobruchus analis]
MVVICILICAYILARRIMSAPHVVRLLRLHSS